MKRAWWPLAWYYAITLAVPIANGAARAGRPFLEHAVVVLAVPPILIALSWSIRRWLVRRLRRSINMQPGGCI